MKTAEDEEFERIEREIAERIEREAKMQFVNCGDCGEKLGDVHTCTPQPAPVPEQPTQQEPVAVVSGYYGGQCVILPIDPARIFNSNTPLYTAPQPAQRTWVGLTDEEVDEWTPEIQTVIRAIEIKLKEKNT